MFNTFLFHYLACGLRCYICVAAEPNSCTEIMTCSVPFNQCSSPKTDGKLLNVRVFAARTDHLQKD